MRETIGRPYTIVMAALAACALALAWQVAVVAGFDRAMPVIALALVQTGVAVRCLVDRRTSVNRRRAQLLSNVSGAVASALLVVTLVWVLADPAATPDPTVSDWAASMAVIDVLGAVAAVAFDADEGRA